MGTRFSSEVGSAKSLDLMHKMDEESTEQDLLIVRWEPEPDGILKEIKRRFPYINVIYFCLRDASKLLANETDHLDGGSRKMRYVFGELFSSRQFDDLETATSQERLLGRLTYLVYWHGNSSCQLPQSYSGRSLSWSLLRYHHLLNMHRGTDPILLISTSCAPILRYLESPTGRMNGKLT